MADAAQLRWRLPTRPALRFRVGAAMADAISPAPDPLPVAAAIGPRGTPGANAQTMEGTLGNGVNTEFDIPHGWNSYAVRADVWLNVAPRVRRLADVSTPTPDTIRIGFRDPPSQDQYGFVLFGPPAAQE